MKTIYGFPFLFSYDYSEGDYAGNDRYKIARRLPVYFAGSSLGMAFPRWNESETRLLLDIVFHQEPDETLLALTPERVVDVCQIPSRIVAINLVEAEIEMDMWGYTKHKTTLLNYINGVPEMCTCGAPYTTIPTVHLTFCNIQPGKGLE